MNRTRRVLTRLLGVVLGLAAVAGAVALAVHWSSTPPEGPVPVAVDHETCAQCRMLISELRFAAQLHTRDGRVLHFDDPGCLFVWEEEHEVAVHERYFRHLREPRWLTDEEVAFVRVHPTPMGFGLGAVERGAEADALSLEEARRLSLERDEAPPP